MHNLNLLQKALVSASEDKILQEAFKIVVKRYFEEYTDEEDLDVRFYSALKIIFELSLGGYDDDGDTFDEFLDKCK